MKKKTITLLLLLIISTTLVTAKIQPLELSYKQTEEKKTITPPEPLPNNAQTLNPTSTSSIAGNGFMARTIFINYLNKNTIPDCFQNELKIKKRLAFAGFLNMKQAKDFQNRIKNYNEQYPYSTNTCLN